MKEETKTKLEKAIEHCADKAAQTTTADDALKYTQAAVNAANAIRSLKD